MFGWLFGKRRERGSDDFGEVSPCCGRYDWPQRAVMVVGCRDAGVHRLKTCLCGHTATRYDCEAHG